MSQYEISIFDIKPLLLATLNAKQVPMLISSPGVGKSSLAREVAQEKKLEYIDIRLAGIDPVYLEGLMIPKGDKIKHLPMEVFPLEGEELPEGKKGWLIHFEELPAAHRAVQVSLYKVLLDRMVGDRKLHSKVYMMASGNKMSDNAAVHPIGTALRSRVITYNVIGDSTKWLEWATNNNLHPTLFAFLYTKRDAINNFDPDAAMHDTFACERTNEMLSRQLYALDKKGIEYKNAMPLIAGTIGFSAANDFYAFFEYGYSAYNIDDLIKNPKLPRPESTQASWITVCNMAASGTKELDLVTDYIDKFDNEFKVIFSRMIVNKNISAMSHSTISKWLSELGNLT